MNQETRKCFFCDNQMVVDKDPQNLNCNCKCINCGNYELSAEINISLEKKSIYQQNSERLYLISGYLREMADKGIDIGLITYENYNMLFTSIGSPKKLSEKVNMILLYLLEKTEYFSQEIIIDTKQYAVFYGKNEDEYKSIIAVLSERGYLIPPKTFGSYTYSMTLEGFTEAESLKRERIDSNQCFVAMMFSEEMNKLFNESVKPIIKEKTGYDAFIISMKEHNNNICDEIIAEIRKSKFLIADFTGQRGGVYFEAGFAYGLGLPVIWTCKKEEVSSLHFDINHYNFILWENPEELCTNLCNRILATIV